MEKKLSTEPVVNQAKQSSNALPEVKGAASDVDKILDEVLPATAFDFDPNQVNVLEVKNPYEGKVVTLWQRKDSVEDAQRKGWSIDVPEAIVKANPSFAMTARTLPGSGFGISQKSGCGRIEKNEMVLMVRRKEVDEKLRNAEYKKAADMADARKHDYTPGAKNVDRKTGSEIVNSDALDRMKREIKAEMFRELKQAKTSVFMDSENSNGLSDEYKEKLGIKTGG